MNLFGIGNLELFAILVVMLLVLGPARMVDVARQAGRWWRESQRFLRSMADAATVALDEKPSPSSPSREPVDGPEDAVARGSLDDVDDDEPMAASGDAEAADDTSADR
ncbi:MAG: twin-arginine translocase TatA/TatE family subunit [Chloroflexi bacterium]|nr:twin-arginine translocase TatA/TatE family subunit [Chloroflexota bacterium]MDA1173453.1 twin-arginine translocase TatA/TatE family subunit [Chloroflexota bacterium]